MPQERMSLADFKALTGKSTGRGTKETRSKEKEKLGQYLLYGGNPWVTEHKFHPTRKWPLDYAWVDLKIGIEYHGAVFDEGHHSRGVGLTDDAEKAAEAQILGWIVITVTALSVKDGRAFDLIDRAVKARQAEARNYDPEANAKYCRTYYQKRVDAGLCPKCGNVPEIGTVCNDCLMKTKIRFCKR